MFLEEPENVPGELLEVLQTDMLVEGLEGQDNLSDYVVQELLDDPLAELLAGWQKVPE
jgi:hypothetical protein